MSAPDFNEQTIELIAYRSAYICANPECNRLTMGPSTADASSKIKIGEAAHIHDARELTIRFGCHLHDKGQSLYKMKVQRAFNNVLKAAEIDNFHFHDLRHCFCSYSIWGKTVCTFTQYHYALGTGICG